MMAGNDNTNHSSEFKALKQEVYETRNMIIKTDNNMRSIFAEIKNLAQKQDEHLSRTKYMSIGLYIILVIILIAGGILLSNLRASNLEKDIDLLQTERNQLRSSLGQAELALESFQATDMRAMKLLELVDHRKRKEAISEFEKLDRKSLQESALSLLIKEVEKFKQELAEEHFKAGISHWKIGGFKRAIQELQLSSSYAIKNDFQNLLNFYLGHSEYKLKKYDEGLTHLLRSLELDKEHDMAQTADYSIGLIYVESKQWQKGIDFFQNLLQRRRMGGFRILILNNIKLCQQKLAAEKRKKEKEKQE